MCVFRLCVFSSRAGLAPAAERTYSAINIEIPLQEQYYRHHYSLFTIALQVAALQISRSLQRPPKTLQRLWARSLQATLQVLRFCTTASEEILHYRRLSLVLQLRACTVPVARYSTVGKCSGSLRAKIEILVLLYFTNQAQQLKALLIPSSSHQKS